MNASHPFDIGITTRTAFTIRGSSQTSHLAARVRVNAAASMGSKANGAMMRATPLAIWAHRLPSAALAAAAADDASLSHPNEACQHANAVYVLACATLIRAPGDASAALAAAEGWAQRHACAEVQAWLAEARDDAAMARYDARPQMGEGCRVELCTAHPSGWLAECPKHAPTQLPPTASSQGSLSTRSACPSTTCASTQASARACATRC